MSEPKVNLAGKLPMLLPRFSCPVCGAKVHLTGITEWGCEEGDIIGVEYECDTEPDIDSDEWPEWHRGHHRMPYVDWLPWETRMLEWLNRHYRHATDKPEDVTR